MNVPQATYEVIYNGKNITANILPYVKSFNYTDKSKGESDELEIVLEDAEMRWQNEWYPLKGDTMRGKIFYLGNVLDCGTFTVDEITSAGGSQGDTLTIKGLAAGINHSIRTKRSYAHENKSLREIVNTIAVKNGFSVTGQINNVTIARETQHRETDLRFLQRLANDYGYTFSIRDKQLVFTDIFSVENKENSLTVKRQELTSYSINDKTSKSFISANISYHSPKQKKVISYQQDEQNESYTAAKKDTLQLHARVENAQQAEIKTKVALYRANSLQQQGNIEMPGNVFVLAGNNCELQFLGMFSGKYYIDSSTHSVDRDGGYTTTADIKRIGLIKKNKK